MVTFTALPTDIVRHWQAGGSDAHGQTPERMVSDGPGNPCRHCLQNIPEGSDMLVLAHRPFQDLHPYAETGPIFICADACTRHDDASTLPPIITTSASYLIKGYSNQDRIVYGTGNIVTPAEMTAKVDDIYADPGVAYIHIRSARNNCYLARINRA
ncbi:MAG: DUF1203 domain-containing protein [Sulfitobacter sp.]